MTLQGAQAPGYAVENNDYPQADKILAEQGIPLERSDGRIALADRMSQGEHVRHREEPLDQCG